MVNSSDWSLAWAVQVDSCDDIRKLLAPEGFDRPFGAADWLVSRIWAARYGKVLGTQLRGLIAYVLPHVTLETLVAALLERPELDTADEVQRASTSSYAQQPADAMTCTSWQERGQKATRVLGLLLCIAAEYDSLESVSKLLDANVDMAAERLVEEALHTSRADDNITVLLLLLRPVEPDVSRGQRPKLQLMKRGASFPSSLLQAASASTPRAVLSCP